MVRKLTKMVRDAHPTIILKNKGVPASYSSPAAQGIPAMFRDRENLWTGFAARSRVLIYNVNLLKASDLPESIFDLTKPAWKGKVAMAYPLFGTTATHIAALYCTMGADKTEKYLQDLQANDVLIVNGNSVVRDLVATGKRAIGFNNRGQTTFFNKRPIEIIHKIINRGLSPIIITQTRIYHHVGSLPLKYQRVSLSIFRKTGSHSRKTGRIPGIINIIIT